MGRGRSRGLAEATYEDVWQTLAALEDDLGAVADLTVYKAKSGRSLVVDARCWWTDHKGDRRELYEQRVVHHYSLSLPQTCFVLVTRLYHALDRLQEVEGRER